MKKNLMVIGVIVAVIAIILLGIYAFRTSNVSYITAVDQEVTALEVELSELSENLAQITLTAEGAENAQVKIATRILKIHSAIDSASNNKGLTDAQKQALVAALDRLKDALTRYKTTLDAVDNKVASSPNRSGSRRISLAESLTEAIDIFEEHVEEVAPEVIPDEPESADENVDADETEITDPDGETTGDMNPTDNASTTDDETIQPAPEGEGASPAEADPAS